MRRPIVTLFALTVLGLFFLWPEPAEAQRSRSREEARTERTQKRSNNKRARERVRTERRQQRSRQERRNQRAGRVERQSDRTRNERTRTERTRRDRQERRTRQDRRENRTRENRTRQDRRENRTRQDRRENRTRNERTRQGRQDRQRQDRTRQGRQQDRTRQDRTRRDRQDRTRRDRQERRTRQDRRENRTRQDRRANRRAEERRRERQRQERYDRRRGDDRRPRARAAYRDRYDRFERRQRDRFTKKRRFTRKRHYDNWRKHRYHYRYNWRKFRSNRYFRRHYYRRGRPAFGFFINLPSFHLYYDHYSYGYTPRFSYRQSVLVESGYGGQRFNNDLEVKTYIRKKVRDVRGDQVEIEFTIDELEIYDRGRFVGTVSNIPNPFRRIRATVFPDGYVEFDRMTYVVGDARSGFELLSTRYAGGDLNQAFGRDVEVGVLDFYKRRVNRVRYSRLYDPSGFRGFVPVELIPDDDYWGFQYISGGYTRNDDYYYGSYDYYSDDFASDDGYFYRREFDEYDGARPSFNTARSTSTSRPNPTGRSFANTGNVEYRTEAGADIALQRRVEIEVVD